MYLTRCYTVAFTVISWPRKKLKIFVQIIPSLDRIEPDRQTVCSLPNTDKIKTCLFVSEHCEVAFTGPLINDHPVHGERWSWGRMWQLRSKLVAVFFAGFDARTGLRRTGLGGN